MEKSNAIEVIRRGGTLTVRFVRPEIRNPLSADVLDAVEVVLRNVSALAGVEKLVFTGTEGVFASGADLREIASLSADDAPAFARRGQALMRGIEELGIETEAMINGYCFGGALDLALACRRRVAVAAARFCHPGAGLGIITGWGGTQRLPRLVGQAAALEMFFTAAPIGAEHALRIGLIDEIAEVS